MSFLNVGDGLGTLKKVRPSVSSVFLVFTLVHNHTMPDIVITSIKLNKVKLKDWVEIWRNLLPVKNIVCPNGSISFEKK